jgi:transcriptional regulator with XRE-family HTH domain
MNELEFQKLLQQELAICQSRNSSYSIRAFSKRLKVSSGTLSQVLPGKRILAKKSVIQILDQLGASPQNRAKVLKEKKSSPMYGQTLLQADQYFVLSEWYYLAILSLVKTKDFKSTSEHVSNRLGISKAIATQALDRLEGGTISTP